MNRSCHLLAKRLAISVDKFTPSARPGRQKLLPLKHLTSHQKSRLCYLLSNRWHMTPLPYMGQKDSWCFLRRPYIKLQNEVLQGVVSSIRTILHAFKDLVKIEKNSLFRVLQMTLYLVQNHSKLDLITQDLARHHSDNNTIKLNDGAVIIMTIQLKTTTFCVHENVSALKIRMLKISRMFNRVASCH